VLLRKAVECVSSDVTWFIAALTPVAPGPNHCEARPQHNPGLAKALAVAIAVADLVKADRDGVRGFRFGISLPQSSDVSL
jgi:hypothetical protein